MAATQPAQGRKSEVIEHDFGKAWAGDAVKHTFEVTNTSDHVLEIRSVTTTCGCTTTSQWEPQVQPSETWTVEIGLNTAGRKGPIRKTITVKTDDPNRPEALLTLKGEIQPRFLFSPAESVTFGALQLGQAAKRTINIVNKYTEPVVFKQAVASSRLIKATLQEVEKGQKYTLEVETVPPLPESTPLGNIVLETDLKEQPKVGLPIYGNIQPRVSLSPKTISVPQPVSNDVQRTLQLTTVPGEKTRIMDVEASNPAIKVVVTEGTNGQPQRIQVTIPTEAVLDEKGETITVFTDDADFPTVTCQVRPYKFSRASLSRHASSQPATVAVPLKATSTQPSSSQPAQVAGTR